MGQRWNLAPLWQASVLIFEKLPMSCSRITLFVVFFQLVGNLSCLLTVYPKGWVYLHSARKYYRAIFELVDWNKAVLRCRELGAYSRLVDINDRTENDAVKHFIRSFDGSHSIMIV